MRCLSPLFGFAGWWKEESTKVAGEGTISLQSLLLQKDECGMRHLMRWKTLGSADNRWETSRSASVGDKTHRIVLAARKIHHLVVLSVRWIGGRSEILTHSTQIDNRPDGGGGGGRSIFFMFDRLQLDLAASLVELLVHLCHLYAIFR